MALILNEAYRVKFYYRQAGVEALMVANWRLLDFVQGATETELAAAFLLDFELATNAPIRASNSTCYRVEVAETFGGLDFGVRDGDVFGLAAAPFAPSFVSIAVRQNVGTRLVRPGQKRIPFTTEALINGNEPALSPGQQAALELGYGAEIEIEYTDPQAVVWTFLVSPMVIGVTLNPNTVPPSYFLDPAKQVDVTSAELTRVTSQVSRKT